jgi:hypothetical protein
MVGRGIVNVDSPDIGGCTPNIHHTTNDCVASSTKAPPVDASPIKQRRIDEQLEKDATSNWKVYVYQQRRHSHQRQQQPSTYALDLADWLVMQLYPATLLAMTSE